MSSPADTLRKNLAALRERDPSYQAEYGPPPTPEELARAEPILLRLQSMFQTEFLLNYTYGREFLAEWWDGEIKGSVWCTPSGEFLALALPREGPVRFLVDFEGHMEVPEHLEQLYQLFRPYRTTEETMEEHTPKSRGGLWRNSAEAPEGKYLVQRRDGTVPEWPYFVLGAKDPAAPDALRAYAKAAEFHGMNPQYVADLYALADEFERYGKTAGYGDPDAAPHRKDNPEVIAKMAQGKGA